MIHPLRVVFVKVGDKVKKGEIMTDGSSDIDALFQYAGREKAQEYVISEVKKPYELPGKHLPHDYFNVLS